MAISADMLRGHTETIILAQLIKNDSYGYEISKAIEDLSHGELAGMFRQVFRHLPDGHSAFQFHIIRV